MFIVLVILGVLMLGTAIAALLIKTGSGKAQSSYDAILSKIDPYLAADNSAKLEAVLSAVNVASGGKKEVKVSSNTATLASYQRKAETLEANIAQLVGDISDLNDFKNEDQIKKYVNANVSKLLTKSGIMQWTPRNGEMFDTATMVKVGGQGVNISEVVEPGFKSGKDVIIKAKVVTK